MRRGWRCDDRRQFADARAVDRRKPVPAGARRPAQRDDVRLERERARDDHTLALAEQIAAFSLPALIAIKASVNRAWESPLSEGILFERHALYGRFASADAHEGMHAFLDKRAPEFHHR